MGKLHVVLGLVGRGFCLMTLSQDHGKAVLVQTENINRGHEIAGDVLWGKQSASAMMGAAAASYKCVSGVKRRRPKSHEKVASLGYLCTFNDTPVTSTLLVLCAYATATQPGAYHHLQPRSVCVTLVG